MTSDEYKAEHGHIYMTRLGMMGAGLAPTADQHNQAVAEADDHVRRLRAENRDGALQALIELRDNL